MKRGESLLFEHSWVILAPVTRIKNLFKSLNLQGTLGLFFWGEEENMARLDG